MLITVGILAYNEEEKIERTLRSLLGQSVFTVDAARYRSDRWNIVVVPNGCKDNTHDVADRTLRFLRGELHVQNVDVQVESLSAPGKSNAWNELIHRIASPATDLFVMMDADIEFAHPSTIHNCIQRLLADERVEVAVDAPLKDFTRKAKLTLFERISAGASTMNDASRPGISGQFYCIRGSFVRQAWMPVGLSVEDGFLNAMVATNCFRAEPDHSKVVRVPDASHYFEGLSSPRKLIQHEVRIVIGTVLNCFLCWDTLLFLTPRDGAGAGELVRRLNQQHPDWYRVMMANQVNSRGRWIVPFSFLTRRFEGAGSQGFARFLLKLPLRFVATLFDGIVYLKANRRLRSGQAIGFW